MWSFYVCSLFKNVPLDETIQICLDKLYALCDSPAIPRPVLKKLLAFATKESHFIFDGQYYDQIYGVVGTFSPLGPVLAKILVCDFDEKWIMNSRWFHRRHFGIDMLMTLLTCLTAKPLLMSFWSTSSAVTIA